MIRGNKRPLDRRPVADLGFKASIHNRFDIEVRDAETGELKQQAKAENIVLDSLWTRMQSSPQSAWFNRIHYGSGQATPSASDKSLTQFVASLSPSEEDYGWNAETGVYHWQRKVSIAAADSVGKQISEVGIAYGDTASYLVTKALLQDMNGNPVSILKTSTDIINIYATVFVHVNPDGYNNGSCKVFCPDTSECFLRYLAGDYFYNSQGTAASWVPYAYRAPYGTADYASEGYDATLLVGSWSEQTATDWSFSASTKQFTLPTKRLDVGYGNTDYGMYYLTLSSSKSYYVKSADIVLYAAPGGWFPGSDIVGEAIGTGDGSTVDFKTKFGYVTNPTIYVDGVPADCVVDVEAPSDAKHTFAARVRAIDENGNPVVSVPTGAGSYNKFYWENPYWETIGIEVVVCKYGYVYASQDMKNWTQVVYAYDRSTPTVGTIQSQYKNYRYWYYVGYGSYNDGVLYAIHSTETRTTNIHFSTPPAAGAVITADYHTPCIAKDENHVFDFSVTIQMGEYTE